MNLHDRSMGQSGPSLTRYQRLKFTTWELSIPVRVAFIGPMISTILRTRLSRLAASPARLVPLFLISALALSLTALAQTETQTPPVATPDTQVAAPAFPPSPTAAPSAAQQQAEPGEITEEELRKLLVGKELFLRGGYLDNTLSFNEHGALNGHSPKGSYTLNGIQIDKVRLTKHKVELEGDRYALHFLGALPYEDPTQAVDRVKITPRKKLVRITIDRELVAKPKPTKERGKPAGTAPKTAPPAPPAAAAVTAQATERPADASSAAGTTSPAHANKVLKDALDNVFAQGFDARMMDSMPGFWKLYYEAAAEKTDYRPRDPAVLRQNMVDTKARLVSTFEPPSNQFAQDYGVVGMCSYHVVIGADGRPGEIAVARPIGFGLDENAVDSIRKATFVPATKDGKPIAVMLDLIVQFRIYSKRTEKAFVPETPAKPAEPSLPGPYSVPHS